MQRSISYKMHLHRMFPFLKKTFPPDFTFPFFCGHIIRTPDERGTKKVNY